MDKILVVDDDQAVLNYLNIFLLQNGTFDVTTLSNSTKAYDMLKNGSYDLLLLDMDMPEVTGLDILKRIHEDSIDVQTIVLTGVEDIGLAVAAMKLGALEYLTKPVDNDRLLNLMRTALDQRRASRNVESELAAAANLRFKEAFKEIVTQDAKMRDVFSTVEKMALTDNSVLIWGESGTGKELIARAIHRISKRNGQSLPAPLQASSLRQSFLDTTRVLSPVLHQVKEGFLKRPTGARFFSMKSVNWLCLFR